MAARRDETIGLTAEADRLILERVMNSFVTAKAPSGRAGRGARRADPGWLQGAGNAAMRAQRGVPSGWPRKRALDGDAKVLPAAQGQRFRRASVQGKPESAACGRGWRLHSNADLHEMAP